MKYTPVIGLEVHVELKTKSKMFCGCSADYFGKEPNTHTCPVCLGMPGTLPVPNKKAIEWCVIIGLALNCEIPEFSKFDRKNYFYPDLPKGYQISQYDRPFCIDGHIKLSIGKKIGIRRVHMEEDTAKLTHAAINNEKVSLIDFNRSGVPLVEIVTEPDFENAEEVVEYLKKLQQIVRYLDVSNADMEKGDMRLEPNISLKNEKSKELPNYKVEVKNINSFKFVEKAINYEINRQSELLEKGETVKQETRGWSEEKGATLPQRGKEEAHDYRYFPEPDIPPVRWTGSQIENLKSQIGELPDTKFERFKNEFGLPDYDVEILTREKETADYFEEAVKVGIKHKITPKQIANWIINKKVSTSNMLPAQLVQTILASSTTARVNEKDLEKIVDKVILDNEQAVSDYRKGKEQALMFLVGKIMKSTKEKIDTNIAKELLVRKLKNG